MASLESYVILYMPFGRDNEHYLDDVETKTIVASNLSDAIKKLLEGAIPEPVDENDDKYPDDVLRNFIRTFMIEGRASTPRNNQEFSTKLQIVSQDADRRNWCLKII